MHVLSGIPLPDDNPVGCLDADSAVATERCCFPCGGTIVPGSWQFESTLRGSEL